MKEKIAIIDLGSNSVRLVLFDIRQDGAFRITNEVKEMVRLSENMSDDMMLKPEAVIRTVNTIKLFKKLCDTSGITNILAVATAAVRAAKNQAAFLALLEKEAGIRFEVISGRREAELGYLGVCCTMDIDSGYTVDIGGASTEITKYIDRKQVEAVSFPFGAVNLTEMFIRKEPDPFKGIEKLEASLEQQLASIPWLQNEKDLPLIGVGGTIRSICKIDRIKKSYSLDITHQYQMNQADVFIIYNEIKGKSYEEICGIPGVSKDRADILPAGVCVVNKLLEALGTNRFIVSGSGIREGIFYSHYLKQMGMPAVENVVEFGMNNFLKLYDVDMNHAKHVTYLAMQVYDQLERLLDSPDKYRQIFERAAFLHDAGINIDFYNRDRHTYYLITNARLNGLTHREIVMAALIASKFSGDKLKNHYLKHSDIVFKEDYKALKKLVVILTVCDKLDRSKSGVIKDVACSIKSDRVVLETLRDGDGALEIAEAVKQNAAFKKVFKKELQIL